ncbi:MAG: nucleotidyltransferase family protein [Pseudomonadota bacterium]
MKQDRRAARTHVREIVDRLVHSPQSMVTLTDAEMDMTLRVGRRARLLGRVGNSLKATGHFEALSPVIADQLEGVLTMANSRRRLALWELDRIDWALADYPAPLIVMKGCTYVLLDLPNAPGRVFADVDLLTERDQLAAVEELLSKRGWETQKLSPYDQNYYRNWTHELPPLVHCEREVEIDLHHNVLPPTSRLKPSSDKLLERSRPVDGSRYRVLCDEDIVLHAMTHLMFDADLDDKIRDLVDIHDLLSYFAEKRDNFWSDFVQRAEEMGLERPAYYSLRYCRRLLQTPVPASVIEASRRWAPPRPVVWLMDVLVPRAMYPPHPDAPSTLDAFCRLLLYMRSHWIRMPPWLLAYHLSYKFFMTRIRRVPNPSANAAG